MGIYERKNAIILSISWGKVAHIGRNVYDREEK